MVVSSTAIFPKSCIGAALITGSINVTAGTVYYLIIG